MVVASSCRERCWVGVPNCATPSLVASGLAGHSEETARDNPGGRRDDVKSSCPYDLGHTRATMAQTKGKESVSLSKS